MISAAALMAGGVAQEETDSSVEAHALPQTPANSEQPNDTIMTPPTDAPNSLRKADVLGETDSYASLEDLQKDCMDPAMLYHIINYDRPLNCSDTNLNASAHSTSSFSLDPNFAVSDTETSADFLAHFRRTSDVARAPLEVAYPLNKTLEGGELPAAFNFAMEHRIFIKASLDLLNERDLQAPELGMMGPIILKSGPLKKASQLLNGIWKVKYVEIRRGMFSYYENAVSKDSTGEGELFRKNVPLQASICHCRPVKLHQKALTLTPGGAIFELSAGGSKRLWMANSREERQAWMQAINNAMVGGSVTRGDSVIDHRGLVRGVSPRSPFKNDLRKYQKTQAAMRNARSKAEYVFGLRDILDHSLQVPVKWVAKQGLLASDSMDGAFLEESVALSIDQLWRDLQRDSVRINDDLLKGDVGHGPERILGALCREILNVSNTSDGASVRGDITEAQAFAYARDILLAGNRTRTGGDSYFCVNSLCKNDELVVVVPSATGAEPIAIDIAHDDSELNFVGRINDKSDWIKTRTRLRRGWKRYFFVASQGTLSYYEGALPRPHGLKGQLALSDSIVSVVQKKHESTGNDARQFVVSIVPKKEGTSKERLLLFESEGRLIDWIYSLTCFATAGGSTVLKKPNRRRSSKDPETPSTLSEILIQAERSTVNIGDELGIDGEFLTNRLSRIRGRTTSMVRVSLRASTEYKIATVDPEGDEEIDTWATIRASFLQMFKVSGGPNGRMVRGEEVVRVSIIDCIKTGATKELSDIHANSPGARTRGRSLRIFRGSTFEDSEEKAKVPAQNID